MTPVRAVVLDDDLPHVEAARAAGWHAVLHVDTPASVAAVEALLAGGASYP